MGTIEQIIREKKASCMDTKLNTPFGPTSRGLMHERQSGTLRTRSVIYSILLFCSLVLSLSLFVSCGSQANPPATTVNPDVKAITDTLSAFCNAIINHDNNKEGEFVRLYLGQHYEPAVYARILNSIQVKYQNVTGCTVGPVTLSADGQTATGRISYTQANRQVFTVDYKLNKYNGTWVLALS